MAAITRRRQPSPGRLRLPVSRRAQAKRGRTGPAPRPPQGGDGGRGRAGSLRRRLTRARPCVGPTRPFPTGPGSSSLGAIPEYRGGPPASLRGRGQEGASPREAKVSPPGAAAAAGALSPPRPCRACAPHSPARGSPWRPPSFSGPEERGSGGGGSDGPRPPPRGGAAGCRRQRCPAEHHSPSPLFRAAFAPPPARRRRAASRGALPACSLGPLRGGQPNPCCLR